eukprot:3422176-Pleurochrysis_carterae.AAC.1
MTPSCAAALLPRGASDSAEPGVRSVALQTSPRVSASRRQISFWSQRFSWRSCVCARSPLVAACTRR